MNHDGDKSEDAHDHSVFHTGHRETLLFSNVIISSEEHLAGACIIIFIAAFIHEGLRLLVNWLQVWSTTRPPRRTARLGILATMQTSAYIVYLCLSYGLMLTFMTMNVWFCLALLLGAGTGYLLFFFQPVSRRLFNALRRSKDTCDDTKSEVTTIYGSNDKQLDDVALSNMTSCH